MTSCRVAICLLLLCVATPRVEAGCFGDDRCAPQKPCTPICWGPDDYCPKPFPCLKPHCTPATCDDYCRKPFPKICPPKVCFGCDDYCRKPMPTTCCIKLPPPAGCGCARDCSREVDDTCCGN